MSGTILKTILTKSFRFQPEDSKTHVNVSFMLKEEYASLRIQCSYSPKLVEEPQLVQSLIEKGLQDYIPPAYREGFDCSEFAQINNLATISLDYENEYIGCAHRHNPVQHHTISAAKSSLGFVNHRILPGLWTVVISLHSISVPTDYEITVEVEEICEIKYKAFELHTHSRHSDGSFTVQRLCEFAKNAEYEGIALTDHNTVSGHQELTTKLMRDTLPVVPGIEWTTFYGHMLVLNVTENIDWRQADCDNIDASIAKIQQTGAVVGLAHPFNPGSPFCTGCYWDFIVKDWNQVDFIEVWSNPFPTTHYFNELAFDLWTRLLNEGYKIAATSGRDWHGPDKEVVHGASTYLGIKGYITGPSAADAIRNGRTYVTAGPCISFSLLKGNDLFELGEIIPAGTAILEVAIDESCRRGQWEEFHIHTKLIRIVHNGEVLQEIQGLKAQTEVHLSPGWIRIEIYGDYLENKTPTILGFTSPIYVA